VTATTNNAGADADWPDCPAKDFIWRCSLLVGHAGDHEWEHADDNY
jgi:hypothetical protein